ncbi:MAG: 8-amino-7-oxononanoate synthase [Polyangiaceae bacterium]
MTDDAKHPEGPLRHLAADLGQLEAAGLLRVRPEPIDGQDGARTIQLSSNDYLGYRASGRLAPYARAAAEEHPAGSGASRLIVGEHRAHRTLETSLARWLGFDESLVFTTGYTANLGVISALAKEGDLIVSDAWNHASIIDGCRLSRAEVAVVPHLDVGAVREALRGSRARRRWVVTEGYFSMEGDTPDLAALRSVCDDYDAALIIDDAHAIGVLGPAGRGCAAAAGVRPDVLIGTLGKALGAQGAFVAGSSDLCRWLWNRARPFVFSTGLSPLLSAIAVGAVKEAQGDDAGRARVLGASSALRQQLADAALPVARSYGPILPVILGEERRALAWGRRLGELGIRILPIRPPTVPRGTSRLRIAVHAGLSESEVGRAVDAMKELLRDGVGE